MPRCKGKVDISFIEKAGTRAARYAKRSQGLKKKAWELSELCGVRVALVCAPAAGAGAPLVWESEDGVLESYRADAVRPDVRGQHTHRSYLEAEVGKGKAKLARARARPGALPDWDAALNDMTPDQAREVLEMVNANLQAARDRMVALGLPADADGPLELEQVAAPCDDTSDDDDDDAIAPPDLTLRMDMDYAGFPTQTMPCHGGSEHHGGLLGQFWVQQERGLEYGGGGRSTNAGAVDETQAPGGYGYNADCRWPDLKMRNAAMPVGYYPYFPDAALAPEHYSPQDVYGRDYAGTLRLKHPMAMNENSSTGTSQHQGSDPWTQSSGTGQAFRYFY